LSFQRFKTIAWKRSKIGEARSRVQDFETFPRLLLKTFKCPDRPAEGKLLGAFVPVAQDHAGRNEDL
jgi:hypothetical protein